MLHVQTNEKRGADPEPNLKDEIQIPKGVENKESNRNTHQDTIENIPQLNPIKMENNPEGNNNVIKPPLMQENIPPVNQENGIKNTKDQDNKTFMQQNKESMQKIT